jgi:hypothetical protein
VTLGVRPGDLLVTEFGIGRIYPQVAIRGLPVRLG